MSWRAAVFLCLLAVVLQPASADDDAPAKAHWRQCYDAIDWFISAQVPDTEAKLMELVQSGELTSFSELWVRKAIGEVGGLESAFVKARREKKLVLWYVPHIEGQHMILPHLLDRYMLVGPLSHPDVTRVVNRRFVPVRLPAGGALGKRFGLTVPAAMEPALLVLTPDGKVVSRTDRISVFDPAYIRRLLVAALPQPHRDRGPVEAAVVERCIDEGDDVDARANLATIRDDVVAHARLSVRLARARGEVPPALRRAVQPLLKRKDAAALRLAWATLLLRQGLAEEALPLLKGDGGVDDAERGYHLGVAQYMSRRENEARATWMEVADRHPSSIWGARADAYAANGTDKAHGEGPLTRGMVYLHGAVPARVRADWQARVRHQGVDFLLQAQRSDGSWEGPRWGGGKEDEDPNTGQRGYGNIKVAITALCSCALRGTPPGERKDDVRKALERAEKLLLQDALVERGEAIVWTYADAFRLLHFSRRLPELPKHRRHRVRRKMQRWIDHLVDHQSANDGCFRHYVYRSTFVTACVTYCLWHAKQAGLNIPNRVFDLAAKAIESARGGPRGLYGYLLNHPTSTRSMKGASGRQPLCEWTLFLLGRRKADDLNKALDIFEEGYAGFESARKGNFHIPALDSTAGYYFFHDFYPACEAARAVGAPQRLLGKLRDLQEPDGTFLDCGFSYGKCYSTAMALLSLEALTRR